MSCATLTSALVAQQATLSYADCQIKSELLQIIKRCCLLFVA
jgi:hypothetical protein